MQALTWPDGRGPELIVDDGGDATLLIHKGYELEHGDNWVNSDSDSMEEAVIKNLLKNVHKKETNHWTEVVKDWKGVSEETTPQESIAFMKCIMQVAYLYLPLM